MNRGAPTAPRSMSISEDMEDGVDFESIFAGYGYGADGFGLLPNYWETWVNRWRAKKKAS